MRLSVLLALSLASLFLIGCGTRYAVTAPAPESGHTFTRLALDSVTAGPDRRGQLEALFPKIAEDRGWTLVEPDGVEAIGDGLVQLRVAVVARSPEPVRLLRTSLARDAGPKSVRQETYLGQAVEARLIVDVADGLGNLRYEAMPVTGHGIADPDPVARRSTGVWTVAGQPVRVFPEQSAALERAALRNAIEAFFVRLESGPTEYTVVFDDSDPGQEPLLKRAVADGIPAVFEDFLNLVESEPENSVACFNLAVCLDLMGRHRDSLEWYGRAIGLDPKDSYQQTLLDAKERAARWDLKADENLDWL